LGLYGVLTYLVELRHRELGVHMALGPPPIHLIGSVIGEGPRMALIGVLLGLGGATLAAAGFESLLFGVAPGDAATFLAVAGFVTAIALLASLVPAFRASRADPFGRAAEPVTEGEPSPPNACLARIASGGSLAPQRYHGIDSCRPAGGKYAARNETMSRIHLNRMFRFVAHGFSANGDSAKLELVSHRYG
jgi:hypothetical protein